MQRIVDAGCVSAGDEPLCVFRFLITVAEGGLWEPAGISIVRVAINQIDSDLVRIRFIRERQHGVPNFHQKRAKLLVDIIDKDILPEVERSPLWNTSISQLQNVSCFASLLFCCASSVAFDRASCWHIIRYFRFDTRSSIATKN